MNVSNSIIPIVFWPNGQKKLKSFTLSIKASSQLSLKRLKELLISSTNVLSKNVDKIILFKDNGIPLDEYDIENLQSNQIIFYSENNQHFSQSNQYHLYTFIKMLKGGGYGKVFLAENSITNELYAIKQIGIDKFSTEDLYSISREKVYLSNLTHKNIIKYYTSFSFENNVYIVMDYAKGGELNKYIQKNGALSESKAKNIFKQVYDAIRFMHSKNCIHRDIKPNNIMFLDEQQNHVIIIDFGICEVSNGNEKEVIKAWTIDYLPPEVASGKEFSSNGKLDVWALGVVFFYMLYAKLPFEGKTEKEIIYNILYSEPNYEYHNINHKLSGNCLNVLHKMLEKSQKFRCGIDAQCFEEWFLSDSYESESFIKKGKTNPPVFNRITTKNNKKSIEYIKENTYNSEYFMNYPVTPYNYMKSLRGCGSPNPKRIKFNNDNTYKMLPKSPQNINCKFQKHFEVPFLPIIKQTKNSTKSTNSVIYPSRSKNK